MRPSGAIVLCLALAGATSALPAQDTARASAVHLLNRAAFGPRPGDIDRVLAMGVDRWVDSQLHPERIPDTDADRYVGRFEVFHRSSGELARAQQETQRRLQAQQGMTPDSARMRRAEPRPDNPLRRYAGELQQAAVARAVLSDRQLYEVLVDFWTNHFNVFMGKGLDRSLLPEYIERTIRPHAMGTFEDLLVATARSPAMLFYLDNWQSVAEGAAPPLARRRQRGSGAAGQQRRRAPHGINENYARELMELHTLGVDGGYTQLDVINVARIFTGWSFRRGPGDLAFAFNDWAHDRGEKTVLGTTFKPSGEPEGLELLRMLARHPSTIRHVSTKLCARFVADQPPDGCIDAAVHAWEKTDGDIREVVRAILTTPDFWAARYRGAKVKTPLEFVASAVRAVGGRPDTTLALGQVVGRLGQPLYLQSAPTGYAEREESWVNASALLERFNAAVGLAAQRLPGITYDPATLIPDAGDREALVNAANRLILHGTASRTTLDVMAREVSNTPNMIAARTLALGLALGSPEFQKQ
jgi:uncharacterized protein (DUF1800 family)